RWGLILRKRCAHNRQEPTEPKEPSLHYVGGSYRAAISAQKGMQAVAAFDVAKFTKRRGERPRIRKSPRNMNNVSNAFARSALECGASSHRFVPCRRLRPRERRDAISIMRPVAFELGKQIEAGRAKGAAPVNPKGFGIEGKSEFNERGTSDEDDNKIQIH